MSLSDCIQRIMNDDTLMDAEDARKRQNFRALGERAQALWRERADQYERQGHPRHSAEALAAQDVKDGFKKEAGENRHVYTAKIASLRQLQAWAAEAKEPDMLRRMEEVDYKTRAQVRRFNGLVKDYLQKHHRDIFGRVKDQAEQIHILSELRGEPSGNASAKAIADAVKHAIEDMRLAFNERGGLIGKLENYDLPHRHDRLAIMNAKFDKWATSIDGRIDWSKVTDPLTGRPIQSGRDGKPPAAFRRTFLKSIYDNIVFGREVDEPTYGKTQGVATYRKNADERVLHFKSAEDWTAYNKEFGSGTMHAALMGHVHRMARDVTLMDAFGPNPGLGAEYYGQLLKKKFKGDEAMTKKVESSVSRGLKAMNVLAGGNVAQDPYTQWIANAASNTRGVMTAAFLDRAVISSLSDMNTMRMAAKSMGMSQTNMIQRQLGLLQGMSKQELLRSQWVSDTQADGGTALARFQQEVPTSEIVERLTQASMRIQGLSWWTDRARATVYAEFSGHLMNFADLPYASLDGPLRRHFDKWGVTADDWDRFRDPAHHFVADNGATFMMPLHWRASVTGNARRNDEIFAKFMGATEEFMELAVPTRSLAAQAWVDPAAHNMEPGSIGYEVLKSAGMFKSWPLTFTVNQYRQIQQAGGFRSKGGLVYALDLVAGATLLGALSIQIGDLAMGRDPQDMTKPEFFGRAALKGGGFAILGDIINTGQASWGGGFASYVAGPQFQLVQDAWDLGPKNIFGAIADAANGEEIDVGFWKDLARMGKRYTPMGQTPIIGPALDRLLWDQMQLLLDPESATDMAATAKRRINDFGGGNYWEPGSPLPSRLPNLGTAIPR
jgi:hypothetical protein